MRNVMWRMVVTFADGTAQTTEHDGFTGMSDSVFALGEDPRIADDDVEIEVTHITITNFQLQGEQHDSRYTGYWQ